MKKLLSLAALVALLAPVAVGAQSVDFGTTYLTSIGLGTQDVRVTVVNLIRVALGILGVVTETNLVFEMQLWLLFRILHLITYLLSINLLRTLSWIGSLVSLVMMGLALI